VPPAPKTTPVDPVVNPAARTAPTTPSTSVQSAAHPDGCRTNVFAAPTAFARADVTVATDSAACLPGIVTERPTHAGSSASTTAGSSDSDASSRS
jgi:hypothetical protein